MKEIRTPFGDFWSKQSRFLFGKFGTRFSHMISTFLGPLKKRQNPNPTWSALHLYVLFRSSFSFGFLLVNISRAAGVTISTLHFQILPRKEFVVPHISNLHEIGPLKLRYLKPIIISYLWKTLLLIQDTTVTWRRSPIKSSMSSISPWENLRIFKMQRTALLSSLNSLYR